MQLQFSDWFGASVITIQNWFNLTRFRIDFSARVFVIINWRSPKHPYIVTISQKGLPINAPVVMCWVQNSITFFSPANNQMMKEIINNNHPCACWYLFASKANNYAGLNLYHELSIFDSGHDFIIFSCVITAPRGTIIRHHKNDQFL